MEEEDPREEGDKIDEDIIIPLPEDELDFSMWNDSSLFGDVGKTAGDGGEGNYKRKKSTTTRHSLTSRPTSRQYIIAS